MQKNKKHSRNPVDGAHETFGMDPSQEHADCIDQLTQNESREAITQNHRDRLLR